MLDSGSYRRNGDGDYRCTREEVRSMMRDQSDVSQDLRVLEQLSLDAFDYESVRRYRIRWQNLKPNHVWENLEDTDFLHKIGCIGRSENGKLHPTAAGVLMFGYEYEIVKEFPNYFLDYQEHDSETMRWTDRIISSSGNLRISIDDALFGGISDPRNANLIKLFNLINIGERSGSGLPSIFEVWETQGWKTPVLEEQFNPDRTVLTLTLS